MEQKWLEDFLLLMETGNFSKAAERRNVSQPAFSRRIQALEHWLGVRLVDRHHKPLKFTPIALAFQSELRNLLNDMYRLRSQMQAEDGGVNRIVVAAQHTLTAAFVPRLIQTLKAAGFYYGYRLKSANKWDCVPLLIQGSAHFLVCHESVDNPARLSSQALNRLRLGTDRLRLVTATMESQPVHSPVPGQALPMLTYPRDSFLGELLWKERMPQLMREAGIETVCESAFAQGLRELTLNGLGLAWLPESLIQDDLASGRLIALDDLASPCEMDIVVYSSRNTLNQDVIGIWSFLQQRWEAP